MKSYTIPNVEVRLVEHGPETAAICRVWDFEGPEERREYVATDRFGGYRWTAASEDGMSFGSRWEAHSFLAGYLFGQTNTVSRPIEGGHR